MIKQEEELKTLEFFLGEDGDIPAVSIVKDPAIERAFQLFKTLDVFKNTNKELFVAQMDKQEITGPVMIPNLKILRYDDNKKEYYNCIFSENTVKDCASIYLKHCNHTYANLDHKNNYTTDVFTVESWIVEDPANDKSNALGFKDVTKGTWYMTYKVTSPELWSTIKTDGFTGFSIEGWFDMFNKKNDEDKQIEFINSLVHSNLSDIDKENILQKYFNTLK